jgi:hypothetical protein
MCKVTTIESGWCFLRGRGREKVMKKIISINGSKIKKCILVISIFGIACCLLVLIPQVREMIIVFGESVIVHRPLTHSAWHSRMVRWGLIGVASCLFILLLLPPKHRERILLGVLAIIVVGGVTISIFLKFPLSAAITLIFGVFSFASMFGYMYLFNKDFRSALISAALYDGVFLWVLTESLGFFKLLGFTGILCGWIGHDIFLLSFLILKYKKENFKIKKLILHIPQLRWEYCTLGIILIVTFFIALLYPPNNWDSMTYHLPRIEHWLQNRSLDHYYTSIDRQTLSAPFAEMAVLQGRALSGDDWFMNLVQWFSFAGTIIGISKITSHLGLNKTMQITAALFFATLPMAILQASSTQTDLVEAFWIVCLVERFLAWKKEGSLRHSIDFGIALGLAILTKGTAYTIALPFVLCFTVSSIKNFRKYLPGAFLAALVCLAINSPHYVRNYMAFANPLGAHSGTISNLSVKSFLITFIMNIFSHVPVRLPSQARALLDGTLNTVWGSIKVDNTIFPFGNPDAAFFGSILFHEDSTKNYFHMLLIIIAFILIFHRNKKEKYAWIVLGSWCIFAFCIPWQPWITRLQVPLFAISAPVFAIAFRNENLLRLRNTIITLLSCFSLLPLFLNYSRPLLPVTKITCEQAIWNTSRNKLVFNNKKSEYQNYVTAFSAIAETKKERLGLVIGLDSWEYPLWRYLRHNMDVLPNIVHVEPDAVDRNMDILFILDRKDVPFIQNDIVQLEDNRPLVLQRGIDDINTWDILR